MAARGLNWLVASLLLVAPLAAQQAGRLEVSLPADARASVRVVVVPLDFAALAAADPTIVLPAGGQPVAVRPRPEGGWDALASQWDQFSAEGEPVVGELTVLVPEGLAGSSLTVLVGPGAPPPPALPADGAVTVAATGTVLTVANPHYQVVHDPAAQAGLPSTITFLPAGKVFSGFQVNDRIYQRDLGGFSLRYDREPEVRLLAAGPLRVVVEVSARYLSAAGQPAPGGARAVYRFSYLRGAPEVGVEVTAVQDEAREWPEFHLLEFNFADESFPGWFGPQMAEDTLFVAEKAATTTRWAALRDGDAVIGLVGGSPSGVKTYDGRGTYGTYLHGPWVPWRTERLGLTQALYLSGQPDSRAALVAAAELPPLWLAGVAVPAGLLARLDRVGLAAQAVAGPAVLRASWWRGLARRWAAAGEVVRAAELTTALEAVDWRRSPAELDAWFAARTGWLVLVAEGICVGVDGGSLVSLYDPGADRELLAGPSELWLLRLRDEAKAYHDYGPGLLPAERAAERTVTATTGGDGQRIELAWPGLPVPSAGPDAVGPRVTLRLGLSAGRLTSQLRIENRTRFSVWEAECPRLSLPELAGGGTDHLFYPRASGIAVPDPWRAGARYEARYPSGSAVMSYQALWDSAGGVYLAACDPSAATRDVVSRGPEADGRVTLLYRWAMPDMGRLGNDWSMPGEGVLALFEGDWYDAARLYREWAAAEAPWWPARAKQRPAPEGYAAIPAWALASGHPWEPHNVVSRTSAFAAWLGQPAVGLHWYNWHEIPFDDQYPHYDPAKPRVAEGVAALQAAGVKVMPYINGRLWDARLDDFKETAHRYATAQEDGEPYVETYGSKVPLAPMCPVTPFWQQKVTDLVLWLTNDLGFDGVYLDQVAAARPPLCFNPDHGHPLGGGSWWCEDGYWPMLTAMREQLAPGKFLTTEDNAEPYAHLFDGYLTWYWQEPLGVPAFSAVYADQIALFGRAYRGGGEQRDLACRMKAAQSLCWGEQLGWLTPEVKDWPSGEFFRQCVQLRAALSEYLAGGEMCRPPALTGDLPPITADWAWRGVWPVTLAAVQTGAWRTADGRLAILLANFSDEPRRVSLNYQPEQYGMSAGPCRVTAMTVAGSQPAEALPETWTKELTIPSEQVLVYLVERR